MNFPVPNQHRTDRRDQSLAQTEHDRIRRRDQLLYIHIQRCGSIENARAVNVKG
jgi:hypothetical protein